ncbi:MAG: hypothetical protein Rubg2KO_21930 [Rubricoccaceae bacterium]
MSVILSEAKNLAGSSDSLPQSEKLPRGQILRRYAPQDDRLGWAGIPFVVGFLLIGLTIAGCSSSLPAANNQLLVFTKTEGFRHGSIEDGVAALRQLGETHGFTIEHTEDASSFTPDALATVDAVVFLNTTGDVLDDAQQTALRDYIHGGGGFVGVHSAADTEYDWPWYGVLVGAYFESHPAIQEATITVTDNDHPATRSLPSLWVRTDEWYNYRTPALPTARVLLHLDASSYEGSTMGDDHPIAWTQDLRDGRSFYTGLGHTSESYAEPLFLAHLTGGICWAARLACER